MTAELAESFHCGFRSATKPAYWKPSIAVAAGDANLQATQQARNVDESLHGRSGQKQANQNAHQLRAEVPNCLPKLAENGQTKYSSTPQVEL